MSDSDLIDMGISAVGDRVKRKAFCKEDGVSKDDKRSEMKRNLAEIMNLSKSQTFQDNKEEGCGKGR